MKECKSKALLAHFCNIISVSLKELFGQHYRKDFYKNLKKKKKTSRSHTKRHQGIINCYKGKAALSRGPHPSIIIWMRRWWRASTSGTFCWINGTANSKKKHGKGNYNNLPQYSSFPEYKCVKSTPFDQKPFQN